MHDRPSVVERIVVRSRKSHKMKFFPFAVLIASAFSCDLELNRDITPGQHLARTWATDAFQCCDKCSDHPECKGFVYVEWRDFEYDTEENCYLKDTSKMQNASWITVNELSRLIYAGTARPKKIQYSGAQPKPTLTKELCEKLDTAQSNSWNRAKFVCFGDVCKCWHSPSGGGVQESTKCKQFPNGKLIDLDSTEAEHAFIKLIRGHGATRSSVYWIGGVPPSSSGQCNVYHWGEGRVTTSCTQYFGYYCEYPVVV